MRHWIRNALESRLAKANNMRTNDDLFTLWHIAFIGSIKWFCSRGSAHNTNPTNCLKGNNYNTYLDCIFCLVPLCLFCCRFWFIVFSWFAMECCGVFAIQFNRMIWVSKAWKYASINIFRFFFCVSLQRKTWNYAWKTFIDCEFIAMNVFFSLLFRSTDIEIRAEQNKLEKLWNKTPINVLRLYSISVCARRKYARTYIRMTTERKSKFVYPKHQWNFISNF